MKSEGRVCGAKRSSGPGYCTLRPIKGRTRCKWHGGRSTGPKTPEGLARAMVAAHAGRDRWVAKMRQMKADGLIDRFPGGRKTDAVILARGALTGDKAIDAAKTRLAEQRVEALRHCPHCGGLLDGPHLGARLDRGVSDIENDSSAPRSRDRRRARAIAVAPAAMADGLVEPSRDTLTRVNRKSLALIEGIVDMPVDKRLDVAAQLKLLGIKKDAALSITGLTARVNSNDLKKAELDMMPELLARLANIEGSKE